MADKTKPSSKEVRDFHYNDDVDGDNNSHHHTLGPGRGQASPGQHSHDGGTSKALFDGVTLTGAKGGNVALTNLIAILVDRLGLTDGTT